MLLTRLLVQEDKRKQGLGRGGSRVGEGVERGWDRSGSRDGEGVGVGRGQG